MVAGRTSCDERRTVVVSLQLFDGRQPGSSGRSSGEPGVADGVGVRIEVSTTCLAEGGQLIEVAGSVNPSELPTIDGRPVHDPEVGAEMEVIDAGHHRAYPSRPFGVAGPMMFRLTDWSADDQHVGGSFRCHAPSRYPGSRALRA